MIKKSISYLKASVFVVFVAGFLLTGCSSISTQDNRKLSKVPQNIDLLKQEITAYYKSGSYSADVDKIGKKAMKVLKSYGETPGKLALVLDIDDTSLLTWGQVKKSQFAYNPVEWAAWAKQAKAPAIKPILALFNQAKKQNIAIFFITGRVEQLKNATVENLKRAGYKGWMGLYLKPSGTNGFVENYKTALRKKLQEQGYRIIINVGDQESDLIGGYADHTFKLPNPCYYIP